MTQQPDKVSEEILKLQTKIKGAGLPSPLLEKLNEDLSRLSQAQNSSLFAQANEQLSHYLDWVTNLPWNRRSDDILDLDFAKKVLDKNHYGLSQIKERVLEYLAVMKQRQGKGMTQESVSLKFMRAPILCFVGLVGTGKTTIAYSIAEAMGRKLERIPFGGMGDPLYLRGQSRVHPESEPGQVIKALRRGGTKNPVILLDEIDRVVEQSRATIMGVLVELLDPEQNMAFNDHYIDYPFDLSEALFIVTCNNTTSISTAVMDRLEPIQMPSYSDEEKTIIAKKYVLPKMMEESGLTPSNLSIAESVWPKIVRPLGYDAGIRTLERTINGICRKVAKLIVEKRGVEFHLTEENIKEFLPTW
ncbi:MAG: AAA family ATPase [bacterium]|nr:AAA family ATPase [bacterium]